MRAFKTCGLLILAAVIGGGPAFAQTAPSSTPNASAPPSAPAQRSETDLEKLVAPIALYPDPLLATLLPASAYPLEIVQATRFIKDTNNISKVDSQSWDQNVKALARFPDVMAKMNDDLDWTSDLGQAFVEDQKGVMGAIQVMRGKAQQAGNLKTTPQQIIVVTNTVTERTVEQKVVYVTNTVVEIQPAQPQVIYVPTYNPTVVYAGPTPGQVAAASVISFGVGMAVGAIIANNCNWHSGGIYVGPHGGAVVWSGGYHGNVNVNVNRNINVNRNVNVNQNINRNANVNRSGNLDQRANAQKWQPDAGRRSSVSSASAQYRGWGGQSSVGSSSHSSSSLGASGHSAFGNYGDSAQTRQASSRGSFSRGRGGFRHR